MMSDVCDYNNIPIVTVFFFTLLSCDSNALKSAIHNLHENGWTAIKFFSSDSHEV